MADDPVFRAAADLRRWMKEDPDVRTAVAGVCARMGCGTVVELADAHPEMIVELHAGFVDMMDEVAFLEDVTDTTISEMRAARDRPAE